MHRAYRLGLLPERRKPVWCAEIDRVFSSIVDAEHFAGVSISDALKYGGTAGGYHWAYSDDQIAVSSMANYIGMSKSVKYTTRAVVCAETGEQFENIRQAKVVGGSGLWACLKGKSQTANGYHWFYADDIEAKARLTEFYGEGKPEKQKIVCYETGEMFDRISDAMQIAPSARQALNNPSLTSGGYHWCLYDNYVNGWEPSHDRRIHVKAKSVICVETRQEFVCVRDAAKWLGDVNNACNIIRCCKNWKFTAKGYHFCYADDVDRFVAGSTKVSWNAHEIRNVDTDEIFESVKFVIAKYPKISKSSLFRACKNGSTAGGYHWKYVEEK